MSNLARGEAPARRPNLELHRPALATRRQVSWVAVVALVLAALAAALSLTALVSTPTKATGIQGATGPQGVQGSQGPVGATGARGPQGVPGVAGRQGPIGPQGAPGPAGKRGAPGTIASSDVVSSTPASAALDPAVGTTVAAGASCPNGKILLGGGARVFVSTPGQKGTGTTIPTIPDSRGVELLSSFPLNGQTWQAIGMVTRSLGAGETMTVQPYALCGTPS